MSSQRLFVTVFGYPHSRYSSTIAFFQSIAESGCTEPELSVDVENAFTIGYNQPWEAARALRKNGEIISGEGGRWMIGVKWVVCFRIGSHLCPMFTVIVINVGPFGC